MPHGRFLLLLWILLQASVAWPQASWVGDVLIGGDPTNLWTACNPCDPDGSPDTNWSTDRIPGDDGPLGDPGTGAAIGPDFVVEQAGGSTLDLSTLDVQGGLIVGGLINISDSATINNIDLESGGALAGPGPVALTGSGTWNGFLRSGGGVTNEAVLTVVTGDLEADLVNNATLIINPSLNFTSTPSLLTNNGSIILNSDTALNNNSNILDGSGAANLLLNQGTIAKSGAALSVIEAPGNHAGGEISASDGTLRFTKRNWQFSGGSMQVGNNGQIELTGNVDHVINGTSGIGGEGRFVVAMSTFGTLTVTQPFVVDLIGSGEHGLLLQSIGMNLEAALTNRQGGIWDGGSINGTGEGRLVIESPLSDPFRILSGGSKMLNGNMNSPGWINQSSSVRIDSPNQFLIESGGGLEILADPASIDWTGNGEIVNFGEVSIQPGARSTIFARFSQADGGRLTSRGELELRGGGLWSGTTFTELAGEDPSIPAISFDRTLSRVNFISGTHEFVDLDSAPGIEILELQDSDLIAASDATVVFDLDEGDEPGFLTDDLARVVMNFGGLGGEGLFENRGNFFWESGVLGVGGVIQFVNALNARLFISNSGNLLDGHLNNPGFVSGGVTMAPGSIIDNSRLWVLNGQTIGVSDPVNPGVFNNSGIFDTDLGTSEAWFDARLNNTGRFWVFGGPGAALRITGPVDQLRDGTLSGGTWIVGKNVTLTFPEAFHTIGPGTIVRGVEGVSGIQALARILGGETFVTGELMLDGGLESINGARIGFDGQSDANVPGGMQSGGGDHVSITEMLTEALVIASAPTPPDQGVTADSGVHKSAAALASTGTPLLTTPLFDNHAILAPGGLGLPGPFNLDGELVMHPGATLDIDIAGTTPIAGHDQLAVTGPITLDGMVQISVAEDFFPAVGQQFVIATAGQSMGGMLDGVVNVNREDIVWSITETADEVIVEVVDVERIFDNGFEG